MSSMSRAAGAPTRARGARVVAVSLAGLLVVHGWSTLALTAYAESFMPINAYGIAPTVGDLVLSRTLMAVVLASAVAALLRRSPGWDVLTIAACAGWGAWIVVDGVGVSWLPVALVLVTAAFSAAAAVLDR